jgi:hypothetical protein
VRRVLHSSHTNVKCLKCLLFIFYSCAVKYYYAGLRPIIRGIYHSYKYSTEPRDIFPPRS